VRQYSTPEAFRQALAAYLSRRSRQLGVPVEVLQRRLVFQRFLARLLRVAPDLWVLSGGAALDWRLAVPAQRTRTTVDLDFLYRATQDQARSELERAAGLSLDDYFVFVVAPGTRITEERERSTRYNVTAYIGRRPYLTFSVDVGILDPLRWTPDHVVIPGLFADLGFGPATVPALPIAHQIAEKIHAITRLSKAGTPRTRVVKDLADLVMISVAEHPTARDVQTAVDAVFRAYKTHPLPSAVPATPTEWERDYREIAQELGIPLGLATADSMVQEFLNPVLQETARGVWDPARRRWIENGIPREQGAGGP
jgi:hypothetical protein